MFRRGTGVRRLPLKIFINDPEHLGHFITIGEEDELGEESFPPIILMPDTDNDDETAEVESRTKKKREKKKKKNESLSSSEHSISEKDSGGTDLFGPDDGAPGAVQPEDEPGSSPEKGLFDKRHGRDSEANAFYQNLQPGVKGELADQDKNVLYWHDQAGRMYDIDGHGDKILKTVNGIKQRIVDKSSKDWCANKDKQEGWYVEGLKRLELATPDGSLPDGAEDSGARSFAYVVFALPRIVVDSAPSWRSCFRHKCRQCD